MPKVASAVVLAMLMLTSALLVSNVERATALGSPVSISQTPILKTRHYSVSFSKPKAAKVSGYDWLQIDNCYYLSKPSQPMLPFRSIIVKLTNGSTIVSVDVQMKESQVDRNCLILPVPMPEAVGSNGQGLREFEDQNVYNSNQPFPNQWYQYHVNYGIDTETSTRVQFLTINLFPMRFLPLDREVLLSNRAEVTVTYVEPKSTLLAETTTSSGFQNLIITSPDLQAEAIELAQWKNATWISSKVVTTTWIYLNYPGVDNQEQIRNCIKDFVATYGITYVTIFGDSDKVPVRQVYVSDGTDSTTPTDLYYADLQGSWDDNRDGKYADQRYDNVDGVPDVFLGRLPASSVQDASTLVAKIKGYEQYFLLQNTWTKRIVLGAGTGSPDGITNPMGNATTVLNEYIAGICTNKSMVRLYESSGNLTTAAMAAQINNGALFVNFAGHGDPGSWLFFWRIPYTWWEGFGKGDASSLWNGFDLPIVTTMACSTARFDDQECIGESFLLKNNGGAIAYFGSTRKAEDWGGVCSWCGLMGEMDWRIYDCYFNGCTKTGQLWAGAVTNYVRTHIWTSYRNASSDDVLTFMEFTMLGDPTTRDGQEIHIKKDGTITPTFVPITRTGNLYTLTGDIHDYASLVVEKDNIIIDGSGFGIFGYGGGTGIDLSGRKSVTVKNMKIESFDYGILFSKSSLNNITNNELKFSNFYGIYAYNSSGNTLAGNLVTACSEGILLDSSYANVLTKNNVTASEYAGIQVDSSNNNRIASNSVCQNNGGGIQLDYSSGNTIADNFVAANGFEGVSLSWSSNNTLSENILESSQDGVVFCGSTHNTLSRNRMVDNTDCGVNLYDSSDCNNISNNWISGNLDGILLSESLNETVFRNTIINNTSGIRFDGSNFNNIYCNNFIENRYQLTGYGTLTVHGYFLYNDTLPTPEGRRIMSAYLLCYNQSTISQTMTVLNYSANPRDQTNMWYYRIVTFSGLRNGDKYFLAFGRRDGWSADWQLKACWNEVSLDGFDKLLNLNLNNWQKTTIPSGHFVTMTSNPNGISLDTIDSSDSGYDFLGYCKFPIGISDNWNEDFRGNYWSDYNGIDVNKDGVGDTNLPWQGVDYYPLMHPETDCRANISPGSAVLDVGQSQLFTSAVSGDTSPYAYQWYANSTPVLGATSNSWTFTPTFSGSYRVYLNVTDSIGAIAISNNATVTVNGPLSVSVLPSSVVMDVGQSRLFTSTVSNGTSPYSYQWYLYLQTGGDLIPFPIAHATGSTWTYTSSSVGAFKFFVQITDSVGFIVESNNVTVTVNPVPHVTISPTSVVMDFDQSQSFTSNVTNGTLPYTYQWYLNDAPVLGATSPTWTFAPPSSGSFNVHLNVTDNVGFRAKSNVVLVTVNPPPSVSISPTSVVMDVGQSKLFTSIVSNGTSPFRYQWYLNGVAKSSATGVSWTFVPDSGGSYTVYLNITDSAGVVAVSNTALVTVSFHDHDVAITNVAPSKHVVVQGSMTSINVTVANFGNYTETFKVTLYVNTTSIGSQNVTLSAGNSATLTFMWNTTGFVYGNYPTSAYAWPVLGETKTANNTFAGVLVWLDPFRWHSRCGGRCHYF